MSASATLLNSSLLPVYGYVGLVVCVAGQRVMELRRSKRHEGMLKARGGYEVAPGHLVAMRILHTAWLLGCLVEAYWRRLPPDLALGVLAVVVFGIGQMLRVVAMRALRERWTVRIVIVPGHPPITHGIYRYLRHPNYLGVILEIAALPLVFGCWITAIVCSVVNAIVLRVRIAAEEAALEAVGGYEHAFGQTRRLLPTRPLSVP